MVGWIELWPRDLQAGRELCLWLECEAAEGPVVQSRQRAMHDVQFGS